MTVAEAALTLDASNPELLGNLSLAYLLAGRLEPARKAMNTALKLDPDDRINQTLSSILAQVERGDRSQPNSLEELTKPPKKKKKWWQF